MSSEQPQGSDRSADALVMLGITGDLGEQKLFPAIVELALAGELGLPIVGVGRSERSDDDLRELVRSAATDALGAGDDADGLVDGIDIRYVSGDAGEVATFDTVAERLEGCRAPVVYAALPPHTFADVANGLAGSALPSTTRLVLEKPFGDDADDARRLHRAIIGEIDADRLFVVDHFLAKSAVENLLTFRCANPMIDALMRSDHVVRIEITMAEEFGVDGRESFYDGVGAVADVMQNHLLQLVAVLTMESPTEDSTAAYDQARADLLGAIRPIEPGDAVLGQFDDYTDHDDIDDDSTTETYAAVRLDIDTDRWRGVPVIVRTGKRLSSTATEAIVVFERGATPNRLRFSFKPDAAITIDLGVLDPIEHSVRPTRLAACAPSDHGRLGDYATMLAGALRGDQRHFAGIDGIVAAWRVVDPLRRAGLVPDRYPSGSMGPERADELLDGPWSPLGVTLTGGG